MNLCCSSVPSFVVSITAATQVLIRIEGCSIFKTKYLGIGFN
jgi:hypothetical protein